MLFASPAPCEVPHLNTPRRDTRARGVEGRPRRPASRPQQRWNCCLAAAGAFSPSPGPSQGLPAPTGESCRTWIRYQWFVWAFALFAILLHITFSAGPRSLFKHTKVTPAPPPPTAALRSAAVCRRPPAAHRPRPCCYAAGSELGGLVLRGIDHRDCHLDVAAAQHERWPCRGEGVPSDAIRLAGHAWLAARPL